MQLRNLVRILEDCAIHTFTSDTKVIELAARVYVHSRSQAAARVWRREAVGATRSPQSHTTERCLRATQSHLSVENT